MPLSPAFSLASFDEVPGWRQDDQAPAFEAFRRSAFHVLTKPYRTGSLGVEFAAFDEAYAEARRVEKLDTTGARPSSSVISCQLWWCFKRASRMRWVLPHPARHQKSYPHP